VAVNKSISPRIRKKLKELYGRKTGVRVGDIKNIQKMLAGGTSIPTFKAKKGGHVRKKKKK
tara:strand:- start:276 stop:458 length:183 start_codon:yes stop_codon:yes gene_type:complete